MSSFFGISQVPTQSQMSSIFGGQVVSEKESAKQAIKEEVRSIAEKILDSNLSSSVKESKNAADLPVSVQEKIDQIKELLKEIAEDYEKDPEKSIDLAKLRDLGKSGFSEQSRDVLEFIFSISLMLHQNEESKEELTLTLYPEEQELVAIENAMTVAEELFEKGEMLPSEKMEEMKKGTMACVDLFRRYVLGS